MARVIDKHEKCSLAEMISWSSPPCDGAPLCHLADIAKALGEHIEAIGAAGNALLALFVDFLGYGAVFRPPSLVLRESAAANGIKTILLWMRSCLNGICKSGLFTRLLLSSGSLLALGVCLIGNSANDASLKSATRREPCLMSGAITIQNRANKCALIHRK